MPDYVVIKMSSGGETYYKKKLEEFRRAMKDYDRFMSDYLKTTQSSKRKKITETDQCKIETIGYLSKKLHEYFPELDEKK